MSEEPGFVLVPVDALRPERRQLDRGEVMRADLGLVQLGDVEDVDDSVAFGVDLGEHDAEAELMQSV